jgi:N-acetylglucosamine-6-sulfatase
MPGKRRPYEEDTRVPLIVRGPGVPAGRILAHMVLNNDLAPTFADLARASVPDFVDGRSLGPLLGKAPPSTADWRQAFIVENWKGALYYKALRTEDHLYVEYSPGGRELYNLCNDPYQLYNQYARADSALVTRLQERLVDLRECAGEGCRTAEDTPPVP